MAIKSVVDHKMTAEEFDAWYDAQPDGRRYEFMDGIVYPNFDGLPDDPYAQGERANHVRLKMAVTRALENALGPDHRACEVLIDGLKVEAGSARFEPDALLRCGARLADDALVVTDPTLVVEVTSPSTKRVDALAKLTRYFENATLTHYLIVLTEERRAIHHRRLPDGRIEAIILSATDKASFDPPGIEISLSNVFGREPDEAA